MKRKNNQTMSTDNKHAKMDEEADNSSTSQVFEAEVECDPEDAMRITDPATLTIKRKEHAERLKRKEQEKDMGDFMKMMQTTRISREECEQEKQTMQQRIEALTLQNLRFKLMMGYKHAVSDAMREYAEKRQEVTGGTVSQAVRRLCELFRGCKTRKQYDARAMSFYRAKDETGTPLKDFDVDLKKEIDGLRQVVVGWWKGLHDIEQMVTPEIPGLMPSIEVQPGYGRAATQIRIIAALDRANWVFSMGKAIEEWYVKGKSSMYTWIEGVLANAGELPEEFVC